MASLRLTKATGTTGVHARPKATSVVEEVVHSEREGSDAIGVPCGNEASNKTPGGLQSLVGVRAECLDRQLFHGEWGRFTGAPGGLDRPALKEVVRKEHRRLLPLVRIARQRR